MARFLRRVVEQDLQGKVLDELELATCAAHCFSNGKPKVSYQQLREGLRNSKWTAATKDELSPGALVVVSAEEGHRRAKVQKVTKGDVCVKYDDGPEHSVSMFQVTPRPQMPSVPAWIIPEDLSNQIRMVEMQVQGAKKALETPIQFITQVLTWKRPCVAFILTLGLLAVSAAEAMVQIGIWADLPGFLEGRVESALGAAMGFAKIALHYCAVVFGVLLLIHRAPLFVELRSITRICLRLLTMRRRAPRIWPFFRNTSSDFGDMP